MSLTVSPLGAEVGLSAATVRYYERLGLLPAPERTAAGYRQYPKEAVERLRFIKSAQRVGLRLREIAELLAICDQGLCPCGHSEALLRERMAEIDAQVAELQAVRAELARVVERYPAAACHDPTATSKWCGTAFAEEGGDGYGLLVLRLPLPRVAVLMLWLPVRAWPTGAERWITQHVERPVSRDETKSSTSVLCCVTWLDERFSAPRHRTGHVLFPDRPAESAGPRLGAGFQDAAREARGRSSPVRG